MLKNIFTHRALLCFIFVPAIFFLFLLTPIESHGEKREPIYLASINREPFYGSNLPHNGYFAVISKEAFKLAGYDLNKHRICQLEMLRYQILIKACTMA